MRANVHAQGSWLERGKRVDDAALSPRCRWTRRFVTRHRAPTACGQRLKAGTDAPVRPRGDRRGIFQRGAAEWGADEQLGRGGHADTRSGHPDPHWRASDQPRAWRAAADAVPVADVAEPDHPRQPGDAEIDGPAHGAAAEDLGPGGRHARHSRLRDAEQSAHRGARTASPDAPPPTEPEEFERCRRADQARPRQKCCTRSSHRCRPSRSRSPC